jgi:tetratricopeptide (TPR) repeat protein
MGRLRDAVLMVSKTSQVHFNNPRVYRLRGELLLRLRELKAAREDLQKALALLIGKVGAAEVVELPESAVAQLTTVQFKASFYLGVTHYVMGAYGPARDVLIEALKVAANDDDLAQAAAWLFFASRRIGDGAAAGEVLRALGPSLQVDLSRHEYELLLGYKGVVPSDTINARALDPAGGDERALYAYGIGLWHLLRGKASDAEPWFEQARTIPNWAALPYLAAEVELARLREKS